MAKKVAILISGVLVSLLIFLGSALRHSNVSGEPFLSEKNLVGAVPVFLVVLLVMAAAFLIPWEELGQKNENKDEVKRGNEKSEP
ncbi:hypothetical protein [Luteimonas suaedae]|uniref:hypothetical protein n=1 Tax=Luteimonas suaedae TaxID=2605430 RepID=UPI0011EC6F64|nr:hypothetical protein [Luteimonas suaedae]